MTPQDILKTIPIFAAALDDAQGVALAGRVVSRKFARGEVLMRQGEVGTSMYVITRGAAEVSIFAAGVKEVLADLGPGDVVGEISLLTGAYRNATVTATRKVTALEIAKPALQALLSEAPDLIPRLAGVIEQRQAEMRRLQTSAAAWDAVGLDRHGIEAMMRKSYGAG